MTSPRGEDPVRCRTRGRRPVAAAAAIPVCAAIGTVGIGLGASSSAVVSAGITAVGAVETAATTIGTTLGGVGLAEP